MVLWTSFYGSDVVPPAEICCICKDFSWLWQLWETSCQGQLSCTFRWQLTGAKRPLRKHRRLPKC